MTGIVKLSNRFLKRNESSNAVINTDHEGLEAYRKRKSAMDKVKEIERIDRDLSNIRKDMNELQSGVNEVLRLLTNLTQSQKKE